MARGRGEGTIYKREDGIWCGQVSLGFDPKTGKRIRKSVYGSKRREVVDKIDKLKQSAEGIQINADNTTLLDWMYKWMEVYKKPKLRPRTYQSYTSIIRVHIADIGQYKLNKVRPMYIQRFINSKASTLSERRMKYILTVLKAGLEQAVINGLIIKNPAAHIEIPKSATEKKAVQAFTREEQQRFEKAIKGEYYEHAFTVALETGMRRGEILGLHWSDIDFKNGVIYVQRGIVEVKQDNKTIILEQEPKTKAGTRDIPMTTLAKRALEKQLIKQNTNRLKLDPDKIEYQDNDLVFATAFGTHVSPRNLSRSFYRILGKAGIEKCGLHTLRHTFATRLVEKNANPKMVQSLMGHSDIAMTMNIYSHALPDAKEDTIRLLERKSQ